MSWMLLSSRWRSCRLRDWKKVVNMIPLQPDQLLLMRFAPSFAGEGSNGTWPTRSPCWPTDNCSIRFASIGCRPTTGGNSRCEAIGAGTEPARPRSIYSLSAAGVAGSDIVRPRPIIPGPTGWSSGPEARSKPRQSIDGTSTPPRCWMRLSIGSNGTSTNIGLQSDGWQNTCTIDARMLTPITQPISPTTSRSVHNLVTRDT